MATEKKLTGSKRVPKSPSKSSPKAAAKIAPRKAVIRNIVEEPWQQFPGHFGGALSKALVRPETAGSRLVDYRISTYQPMAHVELHAHKVQEQIYHVLEGEGMMEIDGERRVALLITKK